MIQAFSMALTGLLVAICVFVHYEALRLLNARLANYASHRSGVLYAVLGMLVAHVLEIWIFALGYLGGIHLIGVGALTPAPMDIFDLVYFSAMVYTTVGFGDVIPDGGLRMIASGEALCGLSLITWSASFTFLQMQRLWDR
jgi:hypothetical protein